ncbi:putative flagellum transition zone component [Leptomonas pyrrhocoris]|uniref:Putative flagellum transition zone component n=1 Tax=Leptomonas pyrrhocoris TaxID=157538 RepID=A0A0N0DWG1_LEPPY|nr:putative flagellum transition zone component [Leptomonas pyrrhocoris]KPA81784.1 putative flagellum transition zone component [Leptomonas pyrrhocoris]|eukprot:XP_015660223.1 putative flagellum transition zone component [Leptomonas pyrrhocoris]
MSSPSFVRSHKLDADAVYVRSPLTADEKALQYLPGSRFLNTTEFKRIYLGAGEDEGTRPSSATAVSDVASFQRRTSFRLAQQDATANVAVVSHIGSSNSSAAPRHLPYGNTNGLVPRRPPSSSTMVLPRTRKGKAVRRLCYGSADNVNEAPLLCTSKPTGYPPAVARQSARGVLDPNCGPMDEAAAASHSSLSQQLRYKVRAARRKSPSALAAVDAAVVHSPSRGRRTDEAWLSLQRELTEKKEEVQSLKRQLLRAQVLVRTLHGVASEEADSTDEEVDRNSVLDAGGDADVVSKEGDVKVKAKVGGKKNNDPGKSPSADQRPKEYWQRRAYFLEKQNEELTVEVEQLRRDARGSKARALAKEVEAMRGELKRCRRQDQGRPVPATAPRATGETEIAATVERGEEGEERGEEGDAATTSFWPVESRRPRHRGPPGSIFASTADEVILREKDDTIRDLRERLRLLTQQYQKADAQVIASTRQLADLTHRHSAMQAEWRALQRLPQELTQLQQQLNTTQAQLLHSDREVEVFHQIFDTLESPATLRAVLDERNHLVELLRQSQQQQADLRDEMKASRQQAIHAIEAKCRAQREEELAMARDREAQHEQTIRQLRKQAETLVDQLEEQREAYEAELAENADERETDLTERLLESVAQGEPEEGVRGFNRSSNINPGATTRNNNNVPPSEQSASASRSSVRSASPSSRPPSRDGPRDADAPRRSPGDGEAVAAAAAVGDLVDSTSALLDTQPSVHALTQINDAPSPLSPKWNDATGTPKERETTRRLDAHADSENSSLTLTSDTESSIAETVTDDGKDSIHGEAKEVVAHTPPNVSSAMVGAPSTSASSRAVPADAAPHDSGAAAVVQPGLVGDETASHSRSNSTNDSSDSTAQDNEDASDETVEKVHGCGSDSFDNSATPPQEQGKMRIGFGFSKSLDAAGPQEVTGSAASSAVRRRPVFDFPAPPTAMHPVSILMSRAPESGIHFASELRAVVQSPATSPQQTSTAVSDPTQSQPTLTESDSDSAEHERGEEEETSSSHSYSSSSSSSSFVAVPVASSSAAVTDQHEAKESTAANADTTRLTEGKASEETAVVPHATAHPSASTIHSGLQSALDNSLDPTLPVTVTDSPAVPRNTQLAASAVASKAAAAASAVPPLSLSAPQAAAAAQSLPLTSTTVPTPTHPSVWSLHDSPTNLPVTTSVKAAPTLSPHAITPLMNSRLYPPRINSAQLLPSLNLEENAADGGPQRSGASPRMQSFDHSGTELSPQFSGNASFDFVGPLAERHRLEDLQNNIVLSLQTSPATLSGGAAGGVPLNPWPLLGFDVRQQSNAVFSSRPGSPPQGDRAISPAPKKENSTNEESETMEGKEEVEQQQQRRVPATGPAKEGVDVSVAGPSQPAAQARTLPTAAHDQAGDDNKEKVSAAQFVQPTASSFPPRRSSGESPSPIRDTSQQEHTLFSFAMDDASDMKNAVDAADADAADTPPVSSPPTEHKDKSPDIPPTGLAENDRDINPAGAATQSPTTAATSSSPAAPLLPLPPMAKVPTPPSAGIAVPPPPRVAVPRPPAPAAAPPTPPPGALTTSRDADVGTAPAAAVAPAAPFAAEGVLSVPSTPQEALALSGADTDEDEREEEEEDDDDDSFSSMPPMLVGGTVEKTRSPPEPRLANELSPFPPHFASPKQPEPTVPRYSASAASSMLGEK